ncbi:MAG: [Fe-Fe] hydrogenase large subunit C-terminal domain-containing protein [Bacteroidales bacterium]|jgi:iron only hydrogenase large subunit-like protein|nr:[Fe-Fe] hydrogenase large subunit C-terminal domain-containing protein [Bacteroidales bacterium]
MKRDMVIYTEKINCQDCYKCIKVCPVKSIKVEDFSASVINDTCIYCGQCINACPAGAKKYREELETVRDWLNHNYDVIACLAPSFVSDFENVTFINFIKAFHALGFSAVSETALGADVVARATAKHLDEKESGVLLATCCPSVVNYIKIYFPELEDFLAPFVSPMIAHARMLRAAGKRDSKLVFIGPCIAKKQEADVYGDEIDAVLTFEEFRELLEVEGVNFQDMERIHLPDNFLIGASDRAGLFPVDSGMISTMCGEIRPVDSGYMSFSGMQSVMEICGELSSWSPEKRVFIELMACDGGCIKGPATAKSPGVAGKRNRLLNDFDIFKRSGLAIPLTYKEIDISNSKYKIPYKINCLYSEEEIKAVLVSMGKQNKSDELNCSGCGYDNCRAYAMAILEGKAEREMCISQMRKEAQNQASILLRKMPYGVVLADENLRIVDTNEKFIEMGGGEIKMISEALGGLAGADLKKVIPYYKYFSAVLSSGEENREFDVREEGRNLSLSIISIQPHKLVCGVIQNMDDSQVIKDIISDKIKEVIRHNAESVQRIAFILGESASFTESVLNSVVEKKRQIN